MTNSLAGANVARSLVIIPAAFMALMFTTLVAGVWVFSSASGRTYSPSQNPQLHSNIEGVPLVMLYPGTVNGDSHSIHVQSTLLSSGSQINEFVELTSAVQPRQDRLTLSVVEPSASVLSTDPVRGLQVQVFECDHRWNLRDASCSGGAGKAVTMSIPVQTMTESPLVLNVSSLAAGAKLYLRIQLSLPSATSLSYTGTRFEPIRDVPSDLVLTFTEQ